MDGRLILDAFAKLHLAAKVETVCNAATDYRFKVLCFSANSTIFFSTNIPFLFLTSST